MISANSPYVFSGYRYHEIRDAHRIDYAYSCVGCGDKYCQYSEDDVVGFIYSNDDKQIICIKCNNNPKSAYYEFDSIMDGS